MWPGVVFVLLAGVPSCRGSGYSAYNEYYQMDPGYDDDTDGNLYDIYGEVDTNPTIMNEPMETRAFTRIRRYGDHDAKSLDPQQLRYVKGALKEILAGHNLDSLSVESNESLEVVPDGTSSPTAAQWRPMYNALLPPDQRRLDFGDLNFKQPRRSGPPPMNSTLTLSGAPGGPTLSGVPGGQTLTGVPGGQTLTGVPSGLTMSGVPSGLTMSGIPSGLTYGNFTVPSGFTIPDNYTHISFGPNMTLPDNMTFPPNMTVPSGVTVTVPLAALITTPTLPQLHITVPTGFTTPAFQQILGGSTTTKARPVIAMNGTLAGPKMDINAIIAIIANLTYDYEWNLTEEFNKTLIEHGVPTCPTGTTLSTTSTTPSPYDFANTSVVGKCFVCGLKTTEIPRNAFCADAFAGDFLPLVPIDPRARGQIASYRKYCRHLDVHNYVENPSEPRSIYGRFTGGCGVRWTDLTGIYTQRTCRARFRPLMGKHFASKRMAKLELALINVENGCIISPMATLLPLSRGVSLYARFHACVCTGSWCNRAARSAPARPGLYTCVLAGWLARYT